jgi:hypothetical protein
MEVEVNRRGAGLRRRSGNPALRLLIRMTECTRGHIVIFLVFDNRTITPGILASYSASSANCTKPNMERSCTGTTHAHQY